MKLVCNGLVYLKCDNQTESKENFYCKHCGVSSCPCGGHKHHSACECVSKCAWFYDDTLHAEWREISAVSFEDPIFIRKSDQIHLRPSQVVCSACDSLLCFSAHERFAKRTVPKGFTPSTAYLYHPNIRKKAMLLFLLRRRKCIDERIPADILLYILQFL